MIAIDRQSDWQKISAGENILDKRISLSTLRALIGQYTAPEETARFETTPLLAFAVVPFFIAMLRALGWGAFYASWMAATFYDAAPFYALLATTLCIGNVLWLDHLSRWKKRRGEINHRRRAARFGLKLMRESWLGWLVLGSVAFFLTLLLAMPLRERADTQVTRYLTLGEIATMK